MPLFLQQHQCTTKLKPLQGTLTLKLALQICFNLLLAETTGRNCFWQKVEETIC